MSRRLSQPIYKTHIRLAHLGQLALDLCPAENSHCLNLTHKPKVYKARLAIENLKSGVLPFFNLPDRERETDLNLT